MSIVTVQLGQCGNQVGADLFNFLQADGNRPPPFTSQGYQENVEYRNQVNETCFTEKERGLLEAKAVLVDMEPKAIQQAKLVAKKCGSWRYPSASEYVQKQGSGNNWALGYDRNGEVASERVVEICRREVEKCDYFAGFLILMSLAGGTGSGFGSRITSILKSNFPEAIIANHVVWPFASGEVILQNYNSVLTLCHLQQSADVIMSQHNEQLHRVCAQLFNIKNISMRDVNNVVSHKLASILQPSYTKEGGRVNVLYELVQAVCGHPCYKFVGLKTVPLISDRCLEFSTYVWPALLKQLYQMLSADSATEGINWELKLPSECVVKEFLSAKRNNKCVANLLVLRGNDSRACDTTAFYNEKLYSRVIQPQYTCTEWLQPRVFNRYEKSATLVTNSQSLVRPLNNCIEKAWKMFNAGAFVHQYEKCGLTESDFIDSFAGVEQILADYKALS